MKGAHLSLEYLKTFRNLAKTHSFRKAAALSFLTQSAISQQLAYLERHFGKKLIEREKGQFILTPEGFLLLEAANSILQTEQNVREAMKKLPNEINGSVQMESAYSVGLHLLPPLLRTFMKNHPKITLNLEYVHSDRILADLLAGNCDMGIIILPPNEPDKFDIHPFIKEKLMYICSPYHPNAKKKSVSIKDLNQAPFVTFNKNLQTRQLIDGIFYKQGVSVNVIHEGENIETLKRVVEVGGGVSILPEATVLLEVKNKTLRSLPLAEGPFYREAGIAIKRGRQLSRAEQTVLHWFLSKK
ncbi:MAG: HTH-type transcriptional activator CmpR [Elusimicrobia bacterium]|nr:HTH-type transcriptional activator CmpR [Elusimicrobiota bacterium]